LEANSVADPTVGRPAGRPTNGQIFDRYASDRSPGQPGKACRSTARSIGSTGELGAYSWSTARSTGFVGD